MGDGKKPDLPLSDDTPRLPGESQAASTFPRIERRSIKMVEVVLLSDEERLRLAPAGMPVREFRDLVDRRGDDPDQWPAHQRGRALLLLEKSAEARAILSEARRLRALAAKSSIKAPRGLVDRIVEKALGSGNPAAPQLKPARAKRTTARTPSRR